MPIFVQRAPVREHLRKYCATKNATVFRTIRFGLQMQTSDGKAGLVEVVNVTRAGGGLVLEKTMSNLVWLIPACSGASFLTC